MRPSERKSEPGQETLEILAIVELLPPGIQLPDVYEIFAKLCEEDPEGVIAGLKRTHEEYGAGILDKEEMDADELTEFLKAYGTYYGKALALALEGLPREFVEYVELPQSDLKRIYDLLQKTDPFPESFELFVEAVTQYPESIELLRLGYVGYEGCKRYDLARSWYTRLYWLADFLSVYRENSGRSNPFEDGRRVFKINNSVAVVGGRIDIEPDRFTEAFVGIPIERLRLCKNCGRVFWAKRRDMVGCSVSCAKVLRTRRWREKITPEQRQKYYIDRMQRERES